MKNHEKSRGVSLLADATRMELRTFSAFLNYTERVSKDGDGGDGAWLVADSVVRKAEEPLELPEIPKWVGGAQKDDENRWG